MVWALASKKHRWRELDQLRQKLSNQLQSTSDHAYEAFRNQLAYALPDSRSSLADNAYLAIDLETNGLEPSSGEIVSIGWVAIDHDGIKLSSSGHVLVEATQGVGDSATIHGIRDCDRHQGMSLHAALTELFAALDKRWPVFHHGQLDLGFLSKACQQVWQQPWPTLYFDTLSWQKNRLQRRHQPIGHGNLQLLQVLNYYHLPLRNAHNALDDAQSCAEVFLALQHQSKSQVGDIGEIFRG